jgi:ABC-type sugar transport system ATPase subunit
VSVTASAPATRESDSTPVLSLAGIEKTYPGVRALRGVDLQIEAGTVRALVGENGAGKSTLLKIVFGAEAPDRGTVTIAGETVSRLTPRSAQERGVRLVSQERQVALDLCVTENVLLGRLPLSRTGAVNWRLAHRQTARELDRLGLKIDPRLSARELSVGSLQALEIARALSAKARLLIMDEPTAALGASEIRALFKTIGSLREQGVAILYVSHHLEEIFEIADSVTVLRDGAHIATRPVTELDVNTLIEMMLGRSLQAVEEAVGTGSEGEQEDVLRLSDVAKRPGLRNVSLSLKRGEIVAVTGAIGSGRWELARCAAGVARPDAGQVEIFPAGKRPRFAREALQSGVAFVPEDRKRDGLFLDLDLVDNIGIGRLSLTRSPIAHPVLRRRTAQQLCQRLGIRSPSLRAHVRLLSGGNQQKAMLARWLNVGARVFVFDEPTAGIDVGTKVEIYTVLRQLTQEGASILMFSSDLEEIKLLAHRAVVLRKGVIAGELRGSKITDDQILRLLMGAQ